MQPNQLDNQPTPTPTPTPNPTPAPSPDLAKALEETPATEPTTPNQPEPATESKPKSSKLPWTCAIIMTILALAGIGFGIYTFMDSNNKSDTISTLETKVKTLNETIDKLQETPTETPTETEDIADKTTITDTEDYIYIGEWGIKIKKTENWRSSIESYEYYNGYPQAADTVTIREVGGKSGDGVAITKNNNGSSQCDGTSVYCVTVEGDLFLISKLDGELTPGTESPITEEFLEFITDSENYSKI